MAADLPHWELLHAFVALAVTLLIMAALLFLAAGTLDWLHGRLFMLVFCGLILVSIGALWQLNPEIFVARARPTGEGTKGWDRVLMTILLVAYAAIFPVAGLDDGRFHWTSVSAWLVALGYVLVIAGFAGVAWAEAVNRGEAESVKAIWRPQNTIAVDAERGASLVRVIGLLEDDDDVQNVYANFEMSDEDLARLDA
jgi:transcriptional regulator